MPKSDGIQSEGIASVSARAYGVRFGVDANDPSLIPALLARLPPGARRWNRTSRPAFECSVVSAVARGEKFWQVRVGDEAEARTKSEADALEAFEGFLRFEVARRAPLWRFVHAGVVGWHGRAILIPGFSFSGKSTLVHALVRAGARYYSDEYAVLDHRGLVYPFAQPITLRRASGGTRRLTAEDLALSPGVSPLRVGTVVSTCYEPGAHWCPVRLSPAGSMLALLQHTVRAQDAPARVMRLLARVAKTAVTLDGPRGEADEVAAALLHHATPPILTKDINVS